ncbi:hypothetical protein ACU64V_12945 [Lysinibacillus capsici]
MNYMQDKDSQVTINPEITQTGLKPKEQIKRVGNSVPLDLPEALVRGNLP